MVVTWWLSAKHGCQRVGFSGFIFLVAVEKPAFSQCDNVLPVDNV